MRTITVEERRARLARRHRLTPGTSAATAVEATAGVVALHATDPASVFLSATARMQTPDVTAVEQALYDDRELVRMLGMRRTLFVVPRDLAGAIQAGCTRAIAATLRRRYTQLLESAGIGGDDTSAWLASVETATMAALTARGEATGAELSAAEPLLRTQLDVAEGKAYATRQNITTWVLTLLAADGRIARGRPRGSWISSQHRWSPLEVWLPGGLGEWSPEDARAELVRH
ncbi:MAG: DNA glycosylase AlkZ-like family protein, partial [Candidatus Dormibacteria bacterium]